MYWRKFNFEINGYSVLYVEDGIARIYGLDKVMASELVEFEDGTIGGGIHSWSTTFVIESIDKCFLKFCKARSNAT